MTDVNEFDFSGGYGGQAAEAGAAKGASFDRLEYMRLDGSAAGIASGANMCILRFLTDHVPAESNPIPWITVDMHSMVPTKNPPSDWPADSKWPRSMSAVCRKDKIFKVKYGDDCYIHTMKKSDGKSYPASGTTWALAVLREEVVGDGSEALGGEAMRGKVVGVRDKTKEVVVTDSDGKPVQGSTKRVPEIVIVQQKWKNFWSIVQGFAARYHTVLDRDYHITRKGDDQSTTYQIVPLDPIQMPDNSIYDLRRPDLFQAKYPDLPDLRKPVAEQASDEYYARFFDPNKTPAPLKKSGGTDTGTAGPVTPAPQAGEPSTEHLAALASRIQGYTPPAEGAAPAAEQPPAAPAPAGAPAPASGGMMNF